MNIFKRKGLIKPTNSIVEDILKIKKKQLLSH
jgi:hypothetical protein